MNALKDLSAQWLEAKEQERAAVERRRVLEDEMRKMLKISEAEEGTIKHVADCYIIKANCRINRKIDPERFLLLANQANINVQEFTRWKCELIMSAWKKQSDEVQKALSSAITSEPGRPTFSIDLTED